MDSYLMRLSHVGEFDGLTCYWGI